MRAQLGAMMAVVAAALLGAGSHSARAEAAADPWELRQNPESCYLSRSFDVGIRKMGVLIQSFGPNLPYHVIVRGPGIPLLADRAVVTKVGFGGEIAPEDVFVLVGKSGGEPMIIFAARPPHPAAIRMMGARYMGTGSDAKVGARVDPSGEVLSIEMDAMDPLSLPIGAMQGEYARLDRCAEALEENWSLAASAGAKPVEGPKLRDPDEVSWHMKYPENLLLNRISGLAELRMTVNSKGRVQDCVVQISIWDDRFGRASCEHLEEIAHFEPARDAQGNPVSALFQTSALFMIYNW